jgi:hypothetical protein
VDVHENTNSCDGQDTTGVAGAFFACTRANNLRKYGPALVP